ncbi:histone deacetylase family protein [Acidisoma cellulosilytica]|uniref:Histone deacetylase family protein n=1 Tax=Acidisoma cellulosilyticum TaxID=2802395 RepID=A0A963Z431_9PROT|nr:histone deacetylase family protein [Acidisoma cellulosilyticum]MCB8882156.1 histone deacetylase family protein [Acidisoma cellulosilyticum]
MKVVYSARQEAHAPEYFLVSGRQRAHPDVPVRIESLLSGVTTLGPDVIDAAPVALPYLKRVHTADYLAFLESAHARWTVLPNAGPEVVPNAHARRDGGGYPTSVVGQAGYHLIDLASPIGRNTWPSVLWNAHSAATAASMVRDGEAAYAYALCRPPGHHAGPDFAAGFCYLNNAAVAVEVLRERFARVALVDIDVHHGNGTQEIFIDRPDVLVASLHGDPAEFYPFFWGYACEQGTGAGLGANINMPLARGTGDDAYLTALETVLHQVRAFRPDALVVSVGFDGFIDDPLAFLALTTPGFARIAQSLSRLNLPTVLVQEGGYNTHELGRNLAAFLHAFETSSDEVTGSAFTQ